LVLLLLLTTEPDFSLGVEVLESTLLPDLFGLEVGKERLRDTELPLSESFLLADLTFTCSLPGAVLELLPAFLFSLV
jgi:hypothetical protein